MKLGPDMKPYFVQYQVSRSKKHLTLKQRSVQYYIIFVSRVLKCDIIRTLKPHHERETVAVRMCANFQITSTTESEDREV